MPDADLLAAIQHPDVEIHLLTVNGHSAGYSELDGRVPGDIELAYFGLFPEFLGHGLGKFFLQWTVQHAWQRQPRRVWVHTCDLDHPAALPLYRSVGFEAYKQEVIEQVVA
jgi:GNAT superfamily N-acetyltransferase